MLLASCKLWGFRQLLIQLWQTSAYSNSVVHLVRFDHSESINYHSISSSVFCSDEWSYFPYTLLHKRRIFAKSLQDPLATYKFTLKMKPYTHPNYRNKLCILHLVKPKKKKMLEGPKYIYKSY